MTSSDEDGALGKALHDFRHRIQEPMVVFSS
jgi:hypothetical protein